MPEFPLADSILTSLNAQEPWPDNVKLFQPYEVEQILLPDNASCLAVQAFLKMCNLPFEVEMRWNAEFMSPSGRVPFIKCGAFVVSELEPIVQFAANKGVTLCGKLSMEEKAEMRAYMSLITNVLVNAELYISWLDDETYNAVTKVRNSSVYPWPLGWLQTRSKRNAVAKRLRALHWAEKTLDQVLADVEQCCNSLSQRLGDKDYFFGNFPTPLDALIFGHMRALLSARGPKSATMIRPITTPLLKHVIRMVSATGMMLTPQEEYLITQAFQVSKRHLSPNQASLDRGTRRRPRLAIRGSRENVAYIRDGRDNYDFKPFESKHILLTTTKEGMTTCALKHDEITKVYSTTTFKMERQHSFIIDIIEDILDKVEEVAFDNLTKFDEKHDFEMVYPHDRVANVNMKINEFLDTIQENDITDTTTSLELAEDLIHVISEGRCRDDDNDTDDNDNEAINNDMDGYVMNNDIMDSYGMNIDMMDSYGMNNDIIDSDGVNNDIMDSFGVNNDIMDSDGVVMDKHLEEVVMIDEKYNFLGSDATDSSNNKNMKDSFVTVSSSGDRTDILRSPLSSGSKSPLKMPSDDEISVESLLKYLRERNAMYGSFNTNIKVADID